MTICCLFHICPSQFGPETLQILRIQISIRNIHSTTSSAVFQHNTSSIFHSIKKKTPWFICIYGFTCSRLICSGVTWLVAPYCGGAHSINYNQQSAEGERRASPWCSDRYLEHGECRFQVFLQWKVSLKRFAVRSLVYRTHSHYLCCASSSLGEMDSAIVAVCCDFIFFHNWKDSILLFCSIFNKYAPLHN